MRVVIVRKDDSRVVICMRHNTLMEARGNSQYLYCEVCAEGSYRSRQRCPDWFPAKFAQINHLDGSNRRVWVWNPDPHIRNKMNYWVRKLTPEQEEFYMARREEQAKLKEAAEPSFVCRPCQIAAEAGLRGEKNHLDAGCKGCDCQHIDRKGVVAK